MRCRSGIARTKLNPLELTPHEPIMRERRVLSAQRNVRPSPQLHPALQIALDSRAQSAAQLWAHRIGLGAHRCSVEIAAFQVACWRSWVYHEVARWLPVSASRPGPGRPWEQQQGREPAHKKRNVAL